MDVAEDVRPIPFNFPCSKCDVEFTNLAKFRDHFRSDWHIYNTNRSLDGFSAITLEDFEKKKAIENEENEEKHENEENEEKHENEENEEKHENEENEKIKIKKKQKCEVCRKKFSSDKQLENHLASKTHRKKLNAVIEKINKMSRDEWDKKNACNTKKTEEETDSVEECVTNLNKWNCLFCDFRCQYLVSNLDHMENEHSFHIPELEYCSNLRGLLQYLEHKISSQFQCIWCNDSGMQSAETVKKHMIDKGHCSIFYEDYAIFEYSNFYDYSPYAYPRIQQTGPENVENDDPEPAILCQLCSICGLCHLCQTIG